MLQTLMMNNTLKVEPDEDSEFKEDPQEKHRKFEPYYLSGTRAIKHQPIHISTFEDKEEALHFYFKEANKLEFANKVLVAQLKAVLEEKRILAEAYLNLQRREKHENEEKRRRHRRCANQIQRKYVCPVKKCEKSYGTEGSMSQHMKLKHPNIAYTPEMCNKDLARVKKEETGNNDS